MFVGRLPDLLDRSLRERDNSYSNVVVVPVANGKTLLAEWSRTPSEVLSGLNRDPGVVGRTSFATLNDLLVKGGVNIHLETTDEVPRTEETAVVNSEFRPTRSRGLVGTGVSDHGGRRHDGGGWESVSPTRYPCPRRSPMVARPLPFRG